MEETTCQLFKDFLSLKDAFKWNAFYHFINLMFGSYSNKKYQILQRFRFIMKHYMKYIYIMHNALKKIIVLLILATAFHRLVLFYKQLHWFLKLHKINSGQNAFRLIYDWLASKVIYFQFRKQLCFMHRNNRFWTGLRLSWIYFKF